MDKNENLEALGCVLQNGLPQPIVLNPFLNSLGNFALSNIGLPPGTGLGCFQSSQDMVKNAIMSKSHICGRLSGSSKILDIH